jgi:hypothetical protein
MFELTIKEKVYPFNFGMGFLREINKKVDIPVNGLPGVKENVGLRYMVGLLMANDPEALVDVLDAANKGLSPRVTRADLDFHIDSEETDIDALFRDVLDFLEKANATKKATKDLREAFEARAKQNEQM